MAHFISEEQEEAQDRSRALMQAASAALTASLGAVLGSALTGQDIRSGVLRAVTLGRVASRRVASAMAETQVRLAGGDLLHDPGVPGSVDTGRAAVVAKTTQETWERHRLEAIASGLSDEDARAQAARSTAWKATQLGLTEVSDVWSDETERAAARATGPRLWKVWDSVLERNTCLICASAHGTAVPAGTPFPDGEPGQVHPSCQCQIIIVSESRVDTDVAAKGPPKGKPAIVVVPKTTAPPSASSARPASPSAAIPQLGAPRSGTPPKGVVGRRRKVDVLPLPVAGKPVAPPAVFKRGRPPTKQEVSERKRAQRIALNEQLMEAAALRRARSSSQVSRGIQSRTAPSP